MGLKQNTGWVQERPLLLTFVVFLFVFNCSHSVFVAFPLAKVPDVLRKALCKYGGRCIAYVSYFYILIYLLAPIYLLARKQVHTSFIRIYMLDVALVNALLENWSRFIIVIKAL